MEINIRDIKKLIELLDGSTVDEIELSKGDEAIRLSRNAPQAYAAPHAQVAMQAPVQMPSAQVATPSAAAPIVEPTQEASEKVTGHQVKSPMVGTLYRSPSPDAPPFVEVGQRVNVGDTLCIIEAMKMMNQIEAEVAGVVKDILVANGSPVEYDEPIVIIDTNA